MAFLRTTKEDIGTERQSNVRDRLGIMATGSVLGLYGMYWLNHSEVGTTGHALSFLAAGISVLAITVPVMKEIEEQIDVNSVISEAQEIVKQAVN